ncbi:MAG: hypothetical protein O9324_05715 [Microcystis sp. LE19-84.1B]|jgi:hypothetical protein|uniref:hypothetical protein n=1 Tax=Microcystis sp. LE19-84.1B TaxID=3016438 RepID=UPI0022C44585|nr:hypothetical protein [Microcystis sp. LE19-84.1B]MCZ8223451.1 hypothetical protein [Microcystis sp. LE19-84.1B]
MRVRKTFLILYLATGLSAGLLSGCNLSGHQAQHSSSSSATGSSMGQSTTVADAQQTAAIKNLKALRQKRKALNTFVANIEVTESGTKVENPVDYAEAKKIVDELANAYKTFKDSLSDDIKTKIGFNNIDSKIEPILEGTSQQRKILEDLAKEQYSEAQNKLSQLKIDSQPIYQSDIDGEDGSRQRIATKKLLEQILNETEPLATLTIDNSSTQNPITSNSLTNSLTTDDLKTQLEQLKKDINRNNWIWPLFNTLALLSLSFIFLRSKRSGVTITYDETKQLTNSSDEQQKTLVELQKINSEIKGLQEKFSWLQILPFNKKQVSSSALKEIETSLENVGKQVNELFKKITISHLVGSNEAETGIITGAKSTSLGENTPDILGDSGGQVSDIEKKDTDQLYQQLKENFDKLKNADFAQLKDQYKQLQKNFEQLKEEMGTESYKKLESRIEKLEQQNENLPNQVQQLQQPKDNSELTANKTETVDIPQQWKDIIDSYNHSPERIFNINGVQLQGEVVEDDQQLEQRRNNLSKPVFLKSHSYPHGYYYIILVENHLVEKHYLLFPKQNAISPSQEFTASALFDGCKSSNNSKFTLILPAQVTWVSDSGMWQLKQKGKLEYN